MDWLIAHQGGWDEALMFILPIALAVGAVKWAEKRGARKRELGENESEDRQPQDSSS